jgi:hypothetical protein
MIETGIGGNVLKVVISMYESVKSCVMFRNEKSDFFKSDIGVRQGENLSPILFAIFLNDFEPVLEGKGGKHLNFISKLYKYRQHYEHIDTDDVLKLFVHFYMQTTQFSWQKMSMNYKHF